MKRLGTALPMLKHERAVVFCYNSHMEAYKGVSLEVFGQKNNQEQANKRK